ncbi:hypothetical protein M885DRAFT_435442 [Pelagophyceae sp. CCMP2097]|nr:hypothetical protein M885DRAFT_435442 [Pelagophyceae sp. CCMP2097]
MRKRALENGASRHTKAGIEQCLVEETSTCSEFEACPTLLKPPRDCLKARILFGADYARMKCCFHCCMQYWIQEKSRLGSNILSHDLKVPAIPMLSGKPNPDVGDFGVDPLRNLLVHPHAYAAISDVHLHPLKGCHVAGDLANLETVVIASYHYEPLKLLNHFEWARTKEFTPCGHALKSLKPSQPLIIDFFAPQKFRADAALLKRVKLLTANNVDDARAGDDLELLKKVQERVIGVRGVSLWQALLEHPHVDRVPRQKRLLLCCCMNVDSKHKVRGPFYIRTLGFLYDSYTF